MLPFTNDSQVIAQRAIGQDAIVGESAVDGAVSGQRAPALPGRDERKPEPGLPLQRRNAVHRTADRIAGQGQLADDLANAAKAVVLRLIDERRYLRRVARDEQESLPALREAADDAAIVRVFVDAVALAAEQRDELIEEFSAARPDPRDILAKEDRKRIR